MMSYSARAALSSNPTAKKLFGIMEKKETNLAVNADVSSKKELLAFAKKVAPYICVLKTHIDLLEDFNLEFAKELQYVAGEGQFIIFEDRKFADIGTIAKKQYEGGIYKIASWADITNAHVVSGPGIIEGLKEAGLPLGRGLLLLAEMSSKGTLAKGSYTESAVAWAQDHPDFVMGFISMRKITDDPRFIHFTPGVKLAEGGDSLGQQYQTPEYVLRQQGSDIMIVGRGIFQANDPENEAARYRDEGRRALF